MYQECRGRDLTPLPLGAALELLFQAIEHLRTAEREWSARGGESSMLIQWTHVGHTPLHVCVASLVQTFPTSSCWLKL